MSKKYLALLFVPAFALGLVACEQAGQDQSAQQPPSGSEQQAMGESGMGQDTMGSQSSEQATAPSSMEQPDQQASQPSGAPPQG